MNMYDLKPETAKQKVTGNNKKVLKERILHDTLYSLGQLATSALQKSVVFTQDIITEFINSFQIVNLGNLSRLSEQRTNKNNA